LLPFIPQVVSSLAILDNCVIAKENKSERIESAIIRVRVDKPKPIEATYERTEYAGGEHGGYGQLTTTPSARPYIERHSAPQSSQTAQESSVSLSDNESAISDSREDVPLRGLTQPSKIHAGHSSQSEDETGSPHSHPSRSSGILRPASHNIDATTHSEGITANSNQQADMNAQSTYSNSSSPYTSVKLRPTSASSPSTSGKFSNINPPPPPPAPPQPQLQSSSGTPLTGLDFTSTENEAKSAPPPKPPKPPRGPKPSSDDPQPST
jgi:hypothetical protein